MKRSVPGILLIVLQCVFLAAEVHAQDKKNSDGLTIDLSGTWMFRIDAADEGMAQHWFSKKLDGNIRLPGSMTSNNKGDDISVNTPWTGSIVDSSWFVKPEYAVYRRPGNIKVPFWLQPVKYYKGAAWYQKEVTVPPSWKGKHLEFYIERSHWETTVWVDDQKIGMQNSLGTAHIFDVSKVLTPGTHRLSVRIDNRIKEINVGENSHSVTDHTQTNWNGMIGRICLTARPSLYLADIQLYPDIAKKQVTVHVTMNNTGTAAGAQLEFVATAQDPRAEKLKMLTKTVQVKDSDDLEIVYPMGDHPLLWDEFHPDLYMLKVRVVQNGVAGEEKEIAFGMRDFAAKGTQFIINGRLTFLRGTLECAIFPKTGYPPTDIDSWIHIFKVARSYGLNHMRFHSWCPPEAAFAAADRTGFYLQIECSSWANQGATIGDGKPLDEYIYNESRHIVQSYGNHPSFCMMAYGNEPAGKNYTAYLTEFVNYWKKRDPRRLYTSGAGWPVVADNNYNSTPDPRIQAWGAGLKSIINSQPPAGNYDWTNIISKWQHPTVSHEIGQWCVYPDFKEIAKYTGVLKAKNFEIFQDKLRNNDMGRLADSFLLASGKLQALCYKADIEAALRTPGFGGFQLLGLYDFPGQGTALVGVLNPFWEDKGYITAKEFSRFCNATVPLARLSKMTFLNNESLIVPVEVAHFGAAPLADVTPYWNIKDAAGKVLFRGNLSKTMIPPGNGHKLGTIEQSLSGVQQAQRLILTIGVGDAQNSWDIFVFPAQLPETNRNILVTQQLDNAALQTLDKGGKVLFSLKKGTLRPEKGGSIAIGFSSIFWNTAWTHSQPPQTLGVLVNPKEPALKDFPTQYHSNWQWWDAMSHSNAIMLDSVSSGLQPLVRVIDDWVTARSLGLVFECKVGKGSLVVTGIDLLADQEKRPEARQLLYSLQNYMAGSGFHPRVEVKAERIKGLTQ